jgi:hypothetical protein
VGVVGVGAGVLAVGVGDAELGVGVGVVGVGVGVGVVGEAVGDELDVLGVGVGVVEWVGDAVGDGLFEAEALGEGEAAVSPSHDWLPPVVAVTAAAAVPAVTPRIPQLVPVSRTPPAAAVTAVRRARAKCM